MNQSVHVFPSVCYTVCLSDCLSVIRAGIALLIATLRRAASWVLLMMLRSHLTVSNMIRCLVCHLIVAFSSVDCSPEYVSATAVSMLSDVLY